MFRRAFLGDEVRKWAVRILAHEPVTESPVSRGREDRSKIRRPPFTRNN
jgi:hypothetical protein